MALLACGIRVQLREVVLRDKPEHMLQLSPKGTVPVLWLADGTVIDESLDIMLWALDRSDPYGWLPADGQQGRATMALLERNDGEFKNHLDRYKYASRYEGADPGEHRRHAESFVAALEERLDANAFLFGASAGLADYAILPSVPLLFWLDDAYLLQMLADEGGA